MAVKEFSKRIDEMKECQGEGDFQRIVNANTPLIILHIKNRRNTAQFML